MDDLPKAEIADHTFPDKWQRTYSGANGAGQSWCYVHSPQYAPRTTSPRGRNAGQSAAPHTRVFGNSKPAATPVPVHPKSQLRCNPLLRK